MPKRRRPTHPRPGPLESFLQYMQDWAVDMTDDLFDALHEKAGDIQRQAERAAREATNALPRPRNAPRQGQGQGRDRQRPQPRSTPQVTAYEILEVSRTASQEVIEAAHRGLAKKYHPDAGGNEEAMKRVNAAYSVLRDPATRQQYDRYIRFQEGRQ